MNRMTISLGATFIGLVIVAVGSASQNSSKKGGNHLHPKGDPVKVAPHKLDSKKTGDARMMGQHHHVDHKKKNHPENKKIAKKNVKGHHPVSGNALNKLSKTHKAAIHAYSLKNAAKLTAQDKGALNKIQSGQQLTQQDRDSLTSLMANDRSMPQEVREAITEALTLDGQSRLTAKSTRFLRLYNGSGEGLKVYVQYLTNNGNTWTWYPTAPADSAPRAVVYELKPGISTTLSTGNDNGVVHASKVRIWAQTASGRLLNEYQKQDLVLVPEVNDAGEPCYFATALETYTYTFSDTGTAFASGLKR